MPDAALWTKATFIAQSNAQAATWLGRRGHGRYEDLQQIDQYLDSYHHLFDGRGTVKELSAILNRVIALITRIIRVRQTTRRQALDSLATQARTRLGTLAAPPPTPAIHPALAAPRAQLGTLAAPPPTPAIHPALAAPRAQLGTLAVPPPTPAINSALPAPQAQLVHSGAGERPLPFVPEMIDISAFKLTELPKARAPTPLETHAEKCGYCSPALIEWLIGGRQILKNVILRDVEVRHLGNGGGASISIFCVRPRIAARHAPTYIIKELGIQFTDKGVDDDRPAYGRMKPHPSFYAALSDGVGGTVYGRDPEGDERDEIHTVARSAIGKMGRLTCADGFSLQLSLDDQLCSYFHVYKGNTYRHDLSILHAARGVSVEDALLQAGSQDAKVAIVKTLGGAIAAFHAKWSQNIEDPRVTLVGYGRFGFLTYVHGDFYPPNVFYDQASKLVTLIDNAGIGKVIALGGANMLTDVKRMSDALSHEVTKKALGVDLGPAFIAAYAKAWNRPKYSAANITAFFASEPNSSIFTDRYV